MVPRESCRFFTPPSLQARLSLDQAPEVQDGPAVVLLQIICCRCAFQIGAAPRIEAGRMIYMRVQVGHRLSVKGFTPNQPVSLCNERHWSA